MIRAVFFDSNTNDLMEMINPARTYVTFNRKEVPQILDIVENSSKEGLYVAGFVSYEAASSFDLALKHQQLQDTPLAWFTEFRATRPFELTENDDVVGYQSSNQIDAFMIVVQNATNMETIQNHFRY